MAEAIDIRELNERIERQSGSAPTDGVTFLDVVFPKRRISLRACLFTASMERRRGVF